MIVRVRVDAQRTTQEFKEARRDVNARTKEGLVEAGRLAFLPEVQARAPSITRTWLTVKATGRRGYITTKGPRVGDRITGFLNFGGTVEQTIVPKSDSGYLSFPGTHQFSGQKIVTKKVTGPRTVKGKHFIEAGMEVGADKFERIMQHAVMKAFDGLDHS